MGAQSNLIDTAHIFIAIMAHKGLAAYALGSSVLESGASKARFWIVIGVFAAATPVGIAFGRLVANVAEGGPAAALSALASGMPSMNLKHLKKAWWLFIPEIWQKQYGHGTYKSECRSSRVPTFIPILASIVFRQSQTLSMEYDSWWHQATLSISFLQFEVITFANDPCSNVSACRHLSLCCLHGGDSKGNAFCGVWPKQAEHTFPWIWGYVFTGTVGLIPSSNLFLYSSGKSNETSIGSQKNLFL